MIDPGEVKVFPACTCAVICCASIFACIALPLSFKSLEQGYYALSLNWSTQKIGDEVMIDPGMHLVGLGNMLVEYPSTFQTMYFVSHLSGRGIDAEDAIRRGPVRARTADGLEMLVSISFQWKLEPSSLIPLYEILGDVYYKDEFVRFARSAIVEASSFWAASEYFTNRTEITDAMRDYLTIAFTNPDKGLSVQIKGLQLREVDLPDAFDFEIAVTQEQMQEVEVAIAEREEQRIGMLREKLIAEHEVTELMQGAIARAEQTRISNDAVVTQMLYMAKEKAKSNGKILTVFRNNSLPFDRLFDYMAVRTLTDHSDDKLLINM